MQGYPGAEGISGNPGKAGLPGKQGLPVSRLNILCSLFLMHKCLFTKTIDILAVFLNFDIGSDCVYDFQGMAMSTFCWMFYN